MLAKGCLLAATILIVGCSSTPSGVSYHLETQRRTEVSASGLGRKVTAEVTDKDTIVRIGGTTFTFADYRGYLGRIDTETGWIKVGSLELRYDGRTAILQSRKAWTNFVISEDQRIWARQDGVFGPDVLKEAK